MTPLRIGVIGSGYWGPNLIRNFAELADAELVAIADLNMGRLTHMRARYPHVALTDNYRDFFDRSLDAVVVATPPATHFALVKECLEHGLHVLVEKPIALESSHAAQLVDLAEASGLALMVGHTFEYNPAVHLLKELIHSGELGQIYYIDTVRVNLGLFQRNLNVLWDLAPHDISILLYLLGSQSLSVNAHGSACVFKSIYDVAYLNLTFADNIMAHIRVSWLDPCKTRRITVVGSKKMVVYDDVASIEKIKIYDKGIDAPPYTDNFGEFQCSYRYGNVVIPHIHFVEPLKQECQHFLDSIRQHTPPQSDGRAGMRVVQVLEAAQSSLDQGGVDRHVALVQPQPLSIALGK